MAFGPSEKLHRFGESHPPNLIPVMNLFLILIPMLVTMTVVVNIAVMGLNLPTQARAGEQQAKEEKPKKLENLIVVLTKDKGILLLGYEEGITNENMFLMGKQKGIRIPDKNNRYDLRTLEKYIKEIKEKYQEQRNINFGCDEPVKYEDLIKAMDLCRRNGLPEIGIREIVTVGIEF